MFLLFPDQFNIILLVLVIGTINEQIDSFFRVERGYGVRAMVSGTEKRQNPYKVDSKIEPLRYNLKIEKYPNS